jgi:hypothetical protein
VAIGCRIALVSGLLAGCGTAQELLGVIVTDSGTVDATSAAPDSGSGSDAGRDADVGAEADAEDAAPPCDPTKPFGAPVLLTDCSHRAQKAASAASPTSSPASSGAPARGEP